MIHTVIRYHLPNQVLSHSRATSGLYT